MWPWGKELESVLIDLFEDLNFCVLEQCTQLSISFENNDHIIVRAVLSNQPPPTFRSRRRLRRKSRLSQCRRRCRNRHGNQKGSDTRDEHVSSQVHSSHAAHYPKFRRETHRAKAIFERSRALQSKLK